MEGSKVLFSLDQGVAMLTLNRPEARNALDTGLVRELHDRLEWMMTAEDVRAVVLTGAGPAFCAGADLKQRQRMAPEEVVDHTNAILQCTNLLEQLPMPVIAAINGPAMAGGMEMALACDLRMAARGATMGLPEVTLGIFPGAGAPLRLPFLVGRGWTKLLVLSGQSITAEEAHRVGLVEILSSAETLVDDARSLAARIAQYNPVAVRSVKALINAVDEMSPAAARLLSGALRHPLNRAAEWSEGLRGRNRGANPEG